MVHVVLMRRLVELVVAGAIGGVVTWFIIRPRFENTNQRLLTLENRFVVIENHVLEFQSMYTEDNATIVYQYNLLKKEIEQLKQNELSIERKQKLNTLLDYLDHVTTEKLNEANIETYITAQTYIT